LAQLCAADDQLKPWVAGTTGTTHAMFHTGDPDEVERWLRAHRHRLIPLSLLERLAIFVCVDDGGERCANLRMDREESPAVDFQYLEPGLVVTNPRTRKLLSQTAWCPIPEDGLDIVSGDRRARIPAAPDPGLHELVLRRESTPGISHILTATRARIQELCPSWLEDEEHQVTPWTQAQIASFDAEAEVSLSDDLQEFLASCDFAFPFAGGYEYTGFDQVREAWAAMTSNLENGSFDEATERATANRGMPENKIAKTYWNRGWIPVSVDGCGNMYCVDLAPEEKGLLGQIIAMECQEGQGPFLTAHSSLLRLLEKQLWYLTHDKYEVYDGAIEIDPWK
jgi:cell wall assembly regulator SMI1